MAKANPEIFAKNLQRLMRKADMELDELSNELLMSKQRLRQWLSGQCFPNEGAMVKICELFGYFDIYKLITEVIDFKTLPDAAKT
jgi:transcriptional regulator with XRE-family HTH domain